MSRRRYGPTPLQLQREAARAQRELERERKELLHTQKEAHDVARADETSRLNQELARKLDEFASVLNRALHPYERIDLDELKQVLEIADFDPGARGQPAPQPQRETFLPKAPSFFAKLLPGSDRKHLLLIEQSEAAYARAVAEHAQHEKEREAQLSQLRAEYDRVAASIRERTARQHAEIESLKSGLAAGSTESIARYFTIALDRSEYPGDFPKHSRTAYVQDSRQLVVEYSFPTLDVIPRVHEYKYPSLQIDRLEPGCLA